MLAQWMAMKGAAARGLRWCSSLAISSLPVPLSPRMRTLASVTAARSVASRASRKAGDLACLVAVAADRETDDAADLVHLERLGDVVVGASVHRRLDVAVIDDGGDDNDREAGIHLANLGEHIQAAHVAHAQVEQYGSGLFVAQGVKGLAPGIVDEHPVVLVEDGAQGFTRPQLVVDDDHCLHHSC